MAEISQKEAKKLQRQNQSLRARFRNERTMRGVQTGAAVAKLATGGGAYASGRFFSDTEVQGINVNWIAGAAGFILSLRPARSELVRRVADIGLGMGYGQLRAMGEEQSE